MGGFNIHMNKAQESNTTKMNSLLNDFAMHNLIKVPTCKRSKNTLDLVIESYTEQKNVKEPPQSHHKGEYLY